jgi:hypothetical protein
VDGSRERKTTLRTHVYSPDNTQSCACALNASVYLATIIESSRCYPMGCDVVLRSYFVGADSKDVAVQLPPSSAGQYTADSIMTFVRVAYHVLKSMEWRTC